MAEFATFFLEGLLFGVEVERVQEVIRYQEMTRVPLAPAMISGLINLRGQIVTAIDMRRRLALAPRPAEQQPTNVVVRTDEGAVSLLVDEIGDVVDVHRATGEAPPNTIDDVARELIREVHKLDDRLLLIIETDKVVRAAQ